MLKPVSGHSKGSENLSLKEYDERSTELIPALYNSIQSPISPSSSTLEV